MAIAPQQPDKLKRLQLRARQVVEGLLTGGHDSPFPGTSVEFASHRAYAPGDDPRHLDWKIYWKNQRLFIKQHEDQTQLSCLLLVDASRSMAYAGTAGPTKWEQAANLAASLAYLLRQQQDAVGLATFGGSLQPALRPAAAARQCTAILQQLAAIEPSGETDLSSLLSSLPPLLDRRGLVILISDLFADRQALLKLLELLRVRRQEVIVFQLLHPDELTFPFDGMTLFRGLEQSPELETDPGALRQSYLDELNTFLAACRRQCARAGADYVLVNSEQPLEAAVAAYLDFRRRARRRTGQRSGGASSSGPASSGPASGGAAPGGASGAAP
ncbi:MAG: DUF58 domain-containing protein [Planctomycetota bacterium]